MPQQVQITVNFNVAAAQAPLIANPASANDALTVGQAAPNTPLSVISGGTPPYGQPVVDPASPGQLPPGLSAAVDENGNFTVNGTAAAPGQGTVIFDVSDSGA